MYQHPDALLNAKYEEIPLDSSIYNPLSGKINIAHRHKHGVTLQVGESGIIKLTACAPDIMRVQIQPGLDCDIQPSLTGRFGLVKEDWEGADFSIADNDELCFSTDAFTALFNKETKDLSIAIGNGEPVISTTDGGIRFSEEEAEYGGHKSFCSFKIGDESFFGFGGRIAQPKRNGTTADIFCIKAGRVSGDYGGFPVPFFISTKGYGVFLNNPWPHVYFDMGCTNNDEWFFHTPGGECDIFVIHGPEMADIVAKYVQITGMAPIPDKWNFGLWCSSLSFETADQVIDVAERLRREKWPCDAVVLDGPWRGGPDFMRAYHKSHEYMSNDIDWHSDFGVGQELVKKLNDMDIKTILHINSRVYKPDTAENGLKNGLLREIGNEVVPRVGNDKAEDYFKSLVTPRVKEGVAGWWTDHADRVSGEISEGIPSRNLFGQMWNRLLVEVMEAEGSPHSLVLTRGSGIGGQRYAIPWPGDTRSGIDAFKDDIWFCLNAGLAGYAFSSVDIGGFTPPSRHENNNSKEAYDEVFNEPNICRRLCQSFFFVPVPRIHNSSQTIAKVPWNCPEKMQNLYRDFLELRYRFTPYVYSYAFHASRTGEPILRPLVYAYRNDKRTHDIDDEFLFGDWLIVAPIVEADKTSRSVYLPAGKWIHYWTDKVFEGPCDIEIDAPMYELAGLPLFVKGGAILATQPAVDSLNNEIPAELKLNVYPDGESIITLNESSELTNIFKCEKRDDEIEIHLENNTVSDRNYCVTLHGVATDIGDITLNGISLSSEYISIDHEKYLVVLNLDIAREQSCKLMLHY